VTIPKMLRLSFKYDRKLFGLLSQCFYASVKELFQDAAGDRRAVPGMVASLQTYGDDPSRFHPHLHCLVSEGLVFPDGSFVRVPSPDPACLTELFRYRLVIALLAYDKISPRLVEIMANWVHPGFSVFQGERIDPDAHQARRRLAGYAARGEGEGRDVPLLSLSPSSAPAVRFRGCGSCVPSVIGDISGAPHPACVILFHPDPRPFPIIAAIQRARRSWGRRGLRFEPAGRLLRKRWQERIPA